MKHTKRTSFDLTIENSKNLGDFSKKLGESYSWTINYMLHIFLDSSEEVKNELADFCNKKVEETEQAMENLPAFEKQEAGQKILQYQDLSFFFMEGKKPDIKRKEDGMKRIYLKEGYVIIPDSPDWVVLDNFSRPSDCMYVGVVVTKEPKDGKKNYHAKFYVYFCDYKYAKDYPADFQDSIFLACCNKDASFKDILNAVVTPIYEGEENYNNMVNKNEYLAAPCPRLFPIYEQDDPLSLYSKDEAPYGIIIVR